MKQPIEYSIKLIVFILSLSTLSGCDLMQLGESDGDKAKKGWSLWVRSVDESGKSWKRKGGYSTAGRCEKGKREVFEDNKRFSKTLTGKRIKGKFYKKKSVSTESDKIVRRYFEDGSASTTYFYCYPDSYDPTKR